MPYSIDPILRTQYNALYTEQDFYVSMYYFYDKNLPFRFALWTLFTFRNCITLSHPIPSIGLNKIYRIMYTKMVKPIHNWESTLSLKFLMNDSLTNYGSHMTTTVG